MGETITLARTLEMLGSTGGETVQQLVGCIARGDTAEGLKIIHRATDSGADARQFSRQVVDYLRGVMMAASGNADLVEATQETRAAMKDLSGKIDPAALYRAIRAFSHAAADLRSGWRPQLPLELALIDSILDPSAPNAPSAQSAAGSPGAGSTARALPQQPAPAAPAPRPAAKLAENPPPYATAPAPAASASDLTLARIRESWSRVLATVRERDSRSYTLFVRAQPVSFDGDLLSIYVDSDLVRQKCSRPETLLLLQGVLAEVIGSPMRIRFAFGKAQSIAEAAAKYPDGGMVDTASREFGAQVIDLP
jgi:DNA polymerase-3 subunit gamma/tau